MKTVRLGAATGWARDRFNHAGDLVRNGRIDYLCFESMSEITMSATQVKNSDTGAHIEYDPYLDKRLRPVLRECVDRKIRIISNQGWMNPPAAAARLVEIARELEIKQLKVAAVYNAVDMIAKVPSMDLAFSGSPLKAKDLGDRMVSVEVYFGADGIVEALRNGADVVLTTRIVDSALYLGPLAYEFGWSLDDPDLAAKGSIIGHLMECASQASGGYFSDPGYKDVPDIEHLGNPIVEVSEEYVRFTKTETTGGLVTPATLKEQLVYEITDPSNYILPNCVVDFTGLRFREIGKNLVETVGFKGRPKPEKLKMLVGIKEGFMNEEYVQFAGPGAYQRAELARKILTERFGIIGFRPTELRMDYVGLNSVHREATPPWNFEPWEVVLRIAAKADSPEMCDLLRQEMDTICMNGPSATGKYGPMSGRIRAVIGMLSALVDRNEVEEKVDYFTV